MNPDELILLLAIIPLGTLLFLGWQTQRRARFDLLNTRDHVFRCAHCQSVYTDDEDVERSRCPKCGMDNEEYEF
ncbi:MAG: hypothetical protein EXS24_02785 [Pedosphaera sp.]|nr:hypothetical protein [Pedosphaera sp.]